MRIKLGVIGTGMAWHRLHLPALKRLSAKYEIVALCDIDEEKVKAAAQKLNISKEDTYTDYLDLLKREDIDTIDLLVPIKENYPIARDILISGKNLIAEKPFAAMPDEAEELITIKDERKLKVMVAENLRYEECYKIIKEIIYSKRLGEVNYFILHTGADFEADVKGDTFAKREWRQRPEFPGGIFLDGGIHDMALLRFLFGDMTDLSAKAIKQAKSYCEYQSIHCLLEFNNQVSGHYTYCSDSKEFNKNLIGLRIFFRDGELYLASKDSGKIELYFKNGKKTKIKFRPEQGYYNELLNYAEGDIVSTPEKEIGDIKLIHAILNKLKEK
ncbi:MAG: Gfo/Idh/MocA family oxidoreductase [Erysipelotrichales bacterium]|nr:Gfo/Idh/MocA family oxidoreductase [Erysipelotrichales bacterium]